jgi:glycosyltransferase involved in cell wall biosynthesis
MARVLWLADAGCHTGFATVTHNIGDRLVEMGHDVHVLAVNHRGDYWPTKMKLYVPTLRNARDIYGMSRITEILELVDPDVVILMNDPQVLLAMLGGNNLDPKHLLKKFHNKILYSPIDGHGQPGMWDELRSAGKWVAYSKHSASYIDGPVVYHGVDTETYHPLSEGPIVMSDNRAVRTKREAKMILGLEPDGFCVLRIDRNSIRKNYPDTVKALWTLMEAHPDVEAVFHCMPNDPTGYNLAAMLSRREDLKSKFIFTGNNDTFLGWPAQDLAVLYNAADVFVSTSWGEGFGLTLAEAAACGVPVIAQNCSTIPEVVGPGGILLEPEREQTVPSGEEQQLPSVGAFVGALERLYRAPGARRKLGEAGREHVLKSFSWDFAARRFHEFIGELTGSDPQED